MSVRIRDNDRGWSRIKRAVDRAVKTQGKVVVVGFVEGENHDGSDLSVAEVAAIHEFGAEVEAADGSVVTIPARSMLRGTFEENRAENVRKLRVLAQATVEGRISVDQALKVFGVDMQGQVVKRINAGITPPNAESTIQRKGSSKPLIDTGQMVQSVTYVVREKR